MNSDRNEELGILRQSYKMYENTREEMKRMNRPTDMIDDEMKQIAARMNALSTDERLEMEEDAKKLVIAQVPKYENIQKIIDNINKDNTIELDNDVIDEIPIRINHFIVNFPSEYEIKPYAVDSFAASYQTLFIALREFENEEKILPLRLKEMEEKEMDIRVDILNYDKTISYSIIYKGCKLEDEPRSPLLRYDSSEMALWNITLSFKETEYEP